MVESQTQDEGLRRVIGIRSLAFSAINLTIGAGIFTLPAVVAGHIGAASFMAYLLCGLLLGLMLLCFIELGTKFPNSGGAYNFVEIAFGPLAGFLVNMLYAFGFAIMADAAVANALLDTLSIFWTSLKDPIYRGCLHFLLFALIAGMNVLGVKQGVRLVEVNTLSKMIPLAIFVLLGVFYSDLKNFEVNSFPTWNRLGEVSLILFFAFGGGAETTLNAAGEIRNPAHTIPRGLLLGVLGIFSIYILVHLAAQGILGDSLAQEKDSPLAAAAFKVVGEGGKILLSLGAAISCFGLISGDILATSRMVFAGARHKIFPPFLGKVHPRFATPYWAVIFYSGVGFLLAISGGFRQLAIISSSSLLLIYIGVILAFVKLRKIKSEGAYRVPGGWLIPVLAMGATLWFLSHLKAQEIAGGILFVAGSALMYFIMKFFIHRKS